MSQTMYQEMKITATDYVYAFIFQYLHDLKSFSFTLNSVHKKVVRPLNSADMFLSKVATPTLHPLSHFRFFQRRREQ